MDLITNYLNEVDIVIKKMEKKYFFSDLIFAFRGESKDYGDTKLIPTLFRKCEENNMITTENRILESICDFNITFKNNSNIQKMIDSQHYIEYSRLLDITFNILKAFFFTVYSEKNKEQDGVVYIFGIPKEFAFSTSSEYLSLYYDNLIDDNIGVFQNDSFKLLTYNMMNERIISQDGGFILYPNNYDLSILDMYFETITIKFEDKEELKELLNKYFNISESSIFPEKSFKGNRIDYDINNRLHYKGSVIIIEMMLLIEKALIEVSFYKYVYKYDLLKVNKIKKIYLEDVINSSKKLLKKPDITKNEEDEIKNLIKMLKRRVELI